MFSRHHHFSITQGRYPRLMVLVWLLVSQFPLPMAHAHDSKVSELQLSKHVQMFHAEDPKEADDLHWHFVIPWKLACGCGDEGEAIAPAATIGYCIADSGAEATNELLAPVECWHCPAIAPSSGDFMRSPPGGYPPIGFLQSYPATDAAQLTCVFLC